MEKEPAPIARLCVLTKPIGVHEYGFNLHAEIGKGQFVGALDEGSPAEKAGLESLDHIVAVNGESIEGLSHKEVVQRIKSDSKRCSLLVLDEEGVLWFREHNLPLSTENVLKLLKIPASLELLSENGKKPREETPLSAEEDNEKDCNSPPSKSPSQSGNHSANASPTAAAIGRHAALPVLPPGTLLANGPRPRLCVLQKGSPSQEFGFNLHAERGKGHFIGAVDVDGIAERAGLVTGQRIVGVNGRLVFPNTPHKEIVQLIKRDPLRTELLVASEEVDRFYTEYGLAFSYDYVQFYSSMASQNGHEKASASNRYRHSPPVVLKAQSSDAFSNGYHSQNHSEQPHLEQHFLRQKRMGSSGSKSAERRTAAALAAKNNGDALRGRGQSLGNRPSTPASTYTPPVAVQIERRSDNMTSIEIGEYDHSDELITSTGEILSEASSLQEEHHQQQQQQKLSSQPQSPTQKRQQQRESHKQEQHPPIGIGTPPSSRCEEKRQNSESCKQNGSVQNETPKNGVGTRGGEKVCEQSRGHSKHVIADDYNSSPSPDYHIGAPPQTPKLSRRYSPPPPPANLQPLEIYPSHQYQQQQYDKSPLSLQSDSSHSHGSHFEKRDSGKDIFSLNAREARKAICGRKKDPRVASQMSLEEKHRRILEL